MKTSSQFLARLVNLCESAVSLVEAQPFQGKKRGADGRIDGLKFFRDVDKKEVRKIVVSVKGGESVGLTMVKDLDQVKTALLGFYSGKRAIQRKGRVLRGRGVGRVGRGWHRVAMKKRAMFAPFRVAAPSMGRTHSLWKCSAGGQSVARPRVELPAVAPIAPRPRG